MRGVEILGSPMALDYDSTRESLRIMRREKGLFWAAISCALASIMTPSGILVAGQFWSSDIPVVSGVLFFPFGMILFIAGGVLYSRWLFVRQAVFRESGIRRRG